MNTLREPLKRADERTADPTASESCSPSRSRQSNPVCELLGCTLPIVLAGMGGVSRSDLVAAVSAAGGFGFLGMVREPPSLIISEVKTLRQRGIHHFGVNIVPAATDPRLLKQQLETIVDLHVPVVGLFWTVDTTIIARLHEAGILVAYQAESVSEAVAAERAGADIIVAQGREAGGHVRGTTPLSDLLPEVRAVVTVPVLAAGGLATGADLVTATALGASGIVLGTTLLATEESFAHPYHKQRLLAAEPSDTLLTDIFHINWPPSAPTRVLSNATTLGARGAERPGARILIGEEEGRPIYLFSTDSPLRSMTGDFESMALYAGTGVGKVTAIHSATEVVAEIAAQAWELTLVEVHERDDVSSSVCFAGEMSGSYMGQLEPDDVASQVAVIVSELSVGLRHAMASIADRRHPDAPPFDHCLTPWARWIAALLPFADSTAGVARPRKAVDPVRLQVTLLERARSVVLRLPEGRLQSTVAALIVALESGDLCAEDHPVPL